MSPSAVSPIDCYSIFSLMDGGKGNKGPTGGGKYGHGKGLELR